MIKRTFVIFLSIIVIYYIILQFYSFSACQSQEDENFYIAENYLYSNTNYQNVIVGSSMSRRINFDSINEFYNLSFGGQSIYDGFEIILRSNKIPKKIYIEINTLNRFENNEFLDRLFNPFLYNIKDEINILRVDKKPCPIIVNQIVKGIQASKKRKINTINNDSTLKNAMLNIQKEKYASTLSKNELEKINNKIESYILKLKKKGIEIVFFELPINYKLSNTNKAIQIRKFVKQNFSETSFVELAIEDFQTTDGIHLGKEESQKYLDLFTKAIK